MDIVLIGLGRIARYHIAALLSTPRYRLCGLCDIRETRVSQAHPEFTLFTDYEQLLDRLAPAAAVIATPPSTHEAIVAAYMMRRCTGLRPSRTSGRARDTMTDIE